MQGVGSEQDVKWSEFERIHVDGEREFDKVEVKREADATKDFEDEFGVGRQKSEPIHSVKVQGGRPGESHLDGGFFGSSNVIRVDLRFGEVPAEATDIVSNSLPMLLLLLLLLAIQWLIMNGIIDMNRLHIEELDKHLLHGLCSFSLSLGTGDRGIELLVERVSDREVCWEELSVGFRATSKGRCHH